MSTEPQGEKKRVSLAKAFEALQAGPIYQVRVSPAPAVKQSETVTRVTRSSAPREDEIDEGSKEEKLLESSPPVSTRPKQTPVSKQKSTPKSKKAVTGKTTKTPSSVPEKDRCRRSDGKEWRCKNPRAEGLSFCLKHASRYKREAIEAGIISPPADSKTVSAEKKKVQKISKPKKEAKPAVEEKQVNSSGVGTRTRRRSVVEDSNEVKDVEDTDLEIAAEVNENLANDKDGEDEVREDMENDDLQAAEEATEPASLVQTPLKLFWSPNSLASWQVQLTLEEAGLEHNSSAVDSVNAPVAMEELADYEIPLTKIPALLSGKAVITESSAIVEAVAFLTRSNNETPLFPKDYAEFFQALQRFHEAKYLTVAVEELIGLFSEGGELSEDNKKEVDRVKGQVVAQLRHWNSVLEGKEFVVGDSFSIADVALVCSIAGAVFMGLDLEKRDFAALHSYHSSLLYRPSIQKTLSLHSLKESLPSAAFFDA